MTKTSSTVRHAVVDSPVGDLILVGIGGSLTGIFYPDHRHGPAAGTLGSRDDELFYDARQQLLDYFQGFRTGFDLSLSPVGNPFQHRVWTLLREIPYGQTRTYGQLAVALGDPNLARAVGAANGRNPLSIVVPCHRVVGAGGALIGYAGGLARKSFLLNLESGASSDASPGVLF